MKQMEPKHWAVVAGLLTGVATQLLTVQRGWTDIASPGFVAGLLIQVATVISAIFVGAPGASAALDRANRNTDLANESTRAALADPPDLGKVDPKRFIGPAVLLACVLDYRGRLRAASTPCLPALGCIAGHEKLNPTIVQALSDVKAVTLAIKATPKGVPASLPDLLKDLQRLRQALSELDVLLPGLANTTSTAETKALALLSQLVGGR